MAMKRKSIKVQHSAETTEKQKVQFVDEWHNFKTYRKDFMTITKLDRTCEKLIQFITENPEVIKINDFLEAEGIPFKTWKSWEFRYEFVKDAVANAKMILGNRRERGLVTRKYDSGSISFMMPFYDEAWREMLELRENLKQKRHDEDGGTKFIIMEKYPESDKVPKKKESNE